jgi:hypothetical protein
VIEEGKTAKEAALMTGINIRTAQHYIKKYNDDEERRLSVSVGKLGTGRKAKLTICTLDFWWNLLMSTQPLSTFRYQAKPMRSISRIIDIHICFAQGPEVRSNTEETPKIACCKE